MAIDDNTLYGLTGAQVKELPEKINAVKGLARELTSADYNWPTASPDGVALWLLAPGAYVWGTTVEVYPFLNNPITSENGFAIVSTESSTHKVRIIWQREDSTLIFIVDNKTTGANTESTNFLFRSNVVDNLTSTSATAPLSANQGKVLKDLIDSIAIRGAGAPTTSTVGTVGQLYQDTTNGDLYICTDATNPYVWEEVGAGGASVNVFTTNEWNALWA